MRFWIVLAAVCLGMPLLHAAEPGCGSVRGWLVFEGEPQPVAAVQGPRGAPPISDENWVIDPATKGVANGFVWMGKVDPATIPPKRSAVPDEQAELDVNGDVFKPHAFVVRARQELRLLNADPHVHFLQFHALRGGQFGVQVNANDRVGVVRTFPQNELLPIQIKDGNFPWMHAYVLVLDHPYGVVTDAKGVFEIADLPVGTHVIKGWHERAGYVEKGRDVRITEGETADLGEIVVRPRD